jgi:hypothetical protein
MFRTILRIVALSAVIALIGCGKGSGAKFASAKPGDMPVGGDWAGVYFSKVEGYLHLVKEGDSISGGWRTTAGDTWGEVNGTANGDLLKFEWTEHKIGMVGPSATRHGKGYFKYSIPKEGEAHEINGERGEGSDETGSQWTAVKQMNMKPDPKSVRPDEYEGQMEGGGWDEGHKGGEQGGEGEGEKKKENNDESGGGLE